nr:uncharacterized protein LOC125420759 [Ziziphus jujuba var. spinosa]
MKDDETLSSYLIRLNDLINQMKTFGESLSNERMVQKSQEQRLNLQVTDSIEKALSTLSVHSKTQHKGVIQSNAAKFQKTWTLKKKKWELKQRFQQRFHGNQAMNTHSVNTVHGGNRWQVGSNQENSKLQCRTCGKYHFGECRFKGKPKCYNCDKFGHWARECPNGKNVQKANCTNQIKLTGNIFYAASEVDSSSKSSERYIDSGCSNHVTGSINLLVDVKRIFMEKFECLIEL